jgi:hypothetical protein
MKQKTIALFFLILFFITMMTQCQPVREVERPRPDRPPQPELRNYVEFRTNYEPNMVHGVVHGGMRRSERKVRLIRVLFFNPKSAIRNPN